MLGEVSANGLVIWDSHTTPARARFHQNKPHLTFTAPQRALRCSPVSAGGGPAGTLPLDAFAAGLGDHTVVTTLCPVGKERMRRLMGVVATGRADLTPLVTHRFSLERIAEAYELFAS